MGQNQDLQFRIIMVQRGTPVPPHSNTSPDKVPSPPSLPKSSPAKLSRESSRVKKSSPEGGSATEIHREEKVDEVRNILLEDEVQELKRVLQEERSKNEYLTNVIEQAQARFMEQSLKDENISEAMSAPPHVQTAGAPRPTNEPQAVARDSLPYNAKVDPLTVLDMTGAHRPPTVEECEVIIKHLLKMNDKQTHELSQLKSDLRDCCIRTSG